jgi:hypothetical protein
MIGGNRQDPALHEGAACGACPACSRSRFVQGGNERLEADPSPIDPMVGNKPVLDFRRQLEDPESMLSSIADASTCIET